MHMDVLTPSNDRLQYSDAMNMIRVIVFYY